MATNAFGQVYVFNVCGEDLTLSTNGMTIAGGTIPGWRSGPGKYQPNGVPVPRTLNASDGSGKMFNGSNLLTLQWIDGLFTAVVRIDGAMLPLNQDLILFVTRSDWQLVNQYAVQVSSGQVTSMSLGAAEVISAQNPA